MVIPFKELKQHNFMLSDINAIFQTAKSSRWQMQNRQKTSFLYVSGGECDFEVDTYKYFKEIYKNEK